LHLVRALRRKRRHVQNGVQAIFSGKNEKGRLAAYELEDEIESSGSPSKNRRKGSPLRISRILVVLVLSGIMLTTIVGFSVVNDGSQRHADLGTSRAGPGTNGTRGTSGSSGTGASPPARIISPMFFAVSTIAEAIVSSNQSFSGTIATNSSDFVIVQIAYSGGSGGNLPDISSVKDSQLSSYTRVAGASPGVSTNFWEQVWTTRASSTTLATDIIATPAWSSCRNPCASSIIITMTIGRYGGVAGIGASTIIAPSASSTSQMVNITASQDGSILVELLSHGASNNCGIDAPQPVTGQVSRNCFTATTERTEFFDHYISVAQTYTESFTWAQLEIQRGIYLELKGYALPNPVQP
jgi:hypothetical protein